MNTDWEKLTKPAANASSGPMNPPQDLRTVIAQIQIPEDVRKILQREKLPCDNNGVLQLWQKSKTFITEAQAFEMEMRKLAVQLMVPEETKKEGVNNVDLGNGFTLKATLNYNYNLKTDKEGVDKVDAIDNVIDDFAKISNEGAFIAGRLFKWSVDLSVSEYRLLVEAAKTSEPAARMLARLNTVLEIKDKAPVLEIKEPKVKK